jgi:RNA polymerase sigma factor (TIGR02999 family)
MAGIAGVLTLLQRFQAGPMSGRHSVTDALGQLRAGDDEALERLMPLVYGDLRRLARRRLAGRKAGGTPATAELVHDAYLKLLGRGRAPFRDRGHFFAVAARAMRQLLIDRARQRGRRKRGGDAAHVPFDEARVAIVGEVEEILAVDEALSRLAQADSRLARVVECRFFAGLSDAETAEALGVSVRTVQREWLRARAWLKNEMTS